MGAIVEGDLDVVDFHGGGLRESGGRGEGRNNGGGGDGERVGLGAGVGFEGVNAVHLLGVLKDLDEGDIGVLNNVSFDHLLKDQGTVVDKGCLGELVDRGLGSVSGGITKEGTQKFLECSQVGRKVGGHAKIGEVSSTGARKVVGNVL